MEDAFSLEIDLTLDLKEEQPRFIQIEHFVERFLQ